MRELSNHNGPITNLRVPYNRPHWKIPPVRALVAGPIIPTDDAVKTVAAGMSIDPQTVSLAHSGRSLAKNIVSIVTCNRDHSVSDWRSQVLYLPSS